MISTAISPNDRNLSPVPGSLIVVVIASLAAQAMHNHHALLMRRRGNPIDVTEHGKDAAAECVRAADCVVVGRCVGMRGALRCLLSALRVQASARFEGFDRALALVVNLAGVQGARARLTRILSEGGI